MAKFLIATTEIYRADTEHEANLLIEEAKKSGYYDLAKYTSEFKERKKGGEIIDSYYKVTLTKKITDEKDPDGCTTIEYKSE